MRSKHILTVGALGVALLGSAVGCSPAQRTPVSAPSTPAASVNLPAPTTPAPTTPALPSPAGPAAEPSSVAGGAAKVSVPNGVGMNYQQAQDLWRGAGLHVAPAIDGTGANRLPVIDSNWVVLSQNPPAGAVVDRGSFITATVKKYTDK